MVFVQLEPTDPRPAVVLRLVGDGLSGTETAAALGLNRKTLSRWRAGIEGFGDAYEQAVRLSFDQTPAGREALDLLVQTWTPEGIDAFVTLTATRSGSVPSSAPQPASQAEDSEEADPPAPGESSPMSPVRIDPVVLDARGRKITRSSRRVVDPSEPYTKVRPPTRDEWLADMAAIALDETQPERVRVTAQASVTALLQPSPGRAPKLAGEVEDAAVAAAARERGRDPGVPASVWEDARQNFLGPATAAAPETDKRGEVVEVEFEQAAPS
jgi:hypothetical protein